MLGRVTPCAPSLVTGEDGAQDDICDAVGILGRLADEFVPGEVPEDYEPAAGSAGYASEVYGGRWLT